MYVRVCVFQDSEVSVSAVLMECVCVCVCVCVSGQ